MISAVWERDDHKCVLCGKRLHRHGYWEADGVYGKDRPEFDHIVPFSEGGKTVAENMRTLCKNCHKTRTSTWRKEKSKKRREDPAQPDLPLVSAPTPDRGAGK